MRVAELICRNSYGVNLCSLAAGFTDHSNSRSLFRMTVNIGGVLIFSKKLAKDMQARAYACYSGEGKECCRQVEYPMNGVVAWEPYSNPDQYGYH